MNNKTGVYVAKYFAYALGLVLLYVLQTTPGLFSVFGVKPNFVLAAAVAIAVFEGEFTGGLYGAFAGVLCDLGGFTIFGFNAIIMLVSCVIVGLLIIYMLRNTLTNYVILLFFVLLARALLDYLLSYVMWGYADIFTLLVQKIIPGIIYSVAVAPLMYYFYRMLYFKFESKIKR